MNYDVVIVGAGPIGCRVGELLGKNIRVLIIDRKKEIGKPVQCTGFNSGRIFELSGVSRKLAINKVSSARFISPGEADFELKPKEPFYVLDREMFDKEIANNAQKKGVEILLETTFKGFRRREKIIIVETDNGEFKTKFLIGADGPNSTVAKSSSLFQPEKILVGVQETVKGSYEKEVCELWFGSKISPGFFAWVVPENEEWARIGLATTKKGMYYLERFIEKRVGDGIRKNKVAGLIRTGLIKRSVADNILLVGDAACQMKPFSGGGLIYGLIGAKIAAEACKVGLEKNRFDTKFLLENYEKKWKEKLSWPIKKGDWLSKIVYNSPDWLLDCGFWFADKFSGIIQKLDPDFL
ncbi:MAG: NAD(P)/FAD-dependent oxidoreductase [Candidatus Aenigmatarchaeota archaeon]